MEKMDKNKNTNLQDVSSLLSSLIEELPEIIPSRLRVLVWICSNCDSEGFIFESMRGIARQLNIAPQTVKLVFDLLVRKGLLKKKNREVYQLTTLKESENNDEEGQG